MAVSWSEDSNSSARFLPACLALYMAASASRSMVVGDGRSPQATLMPMLAEMCSSRSARSIGSLIAARTRAARAVTSSSE